MNTGKITKLGRHEFTTIDGISSRRLVGTSEWEPTERPPSPERETNTLHLVRQVQAPGEPDHWSLFVTRDGVVGSSYQVKGDAEAMRCAHMDNTRVMLSASFRDSFVLARPNEGEVGRLQYWAATEPPPSASDAASITENCQGWAIRVMDRLANEHIVEHRWIDFARTIQQPIG